MSNISRIRVTIVGTRPLLQHAFTEESIALEKQEKEGVAGRNPDEWKKTCMVSKKGELYVEGTYFFSAIRDAARFTKAGRGTMQSTVAATLQVEEMTVPLGRKLPKTPTRDKSAPVYIDVRGVRNPTTKARNVRYRLACSPGWKAVFTIVFDKTMVTREVMRAIVEDASRFTGLGDGRSIGFGRFQVTKWEELNNAKKKAAA